ncbi:hypothetical protein [Actinokineospora iranica]|uniref:Ketohydroxyglutarate aldolase n=1 Tax=Actinokineospora iranica TaxID=1271860 RepID=A0A1G6IY39_9PSEU|nr:hypothetical protein [Actinokineospora iranica]SDC11404.1 hypothetical protein SAMN05216174_101150 [Actinokineospora iranica]
MTEPVTVTVDDDGLARLPEVVAALEAAGMRVERVLAAIGAVTGTAAPDAIGDLRAVAGVDGVEPASAPFRLPPPDSDVQ